MTKDMDLVPIEVEIDDETWAHLCKVAEWSLTTPEDVLRVILALEAVKLDLMDKVKLEKPPDGRASRVRNKDDSTARRTAKTGRTVAKTQRGVGKRKPRPKAKSRSP